MVEQKVVNEKELEQESKALIVKAQDFKIVSVESYKEVADFRTDLKGMIKKAEAFIKPLVEADYKKWKMSKAKQAELVNPLNEALRFCNKKLQDYNAEQERIQREKQRKIDEAAEKERRKAEEKAKKELMKGNEEKAEQILTKVEEKKPEIVEKEVPKVADIKYRSVYRHRVKNPEKLTREWLMQDDVKIGGEVRRSKGTVKIEGVEIWIEKIPV